MLCLALIMGFTTFTFAGCSDGGNNTGSGGSVSSSGDSTTNPGGGTSGGGSTSGGESTTPVVSDPQLKTMGTYFSGIRAEYEKTNFLNQNNQTRTFEQLLDQQLEVLTQDLIYRLTYVYGSENNGNNLRVSENDIITLKNNDGINYEYSGNIAKSKNTSIVKNLGYSVLESDELRSINLKDVNVIDSIQKSFIIKSGTNYLNHNSRLKFVGAIAGYNTQIINVDGEFAFASSNKKWNMSSEVANYNTMLSQYKDTIKLGIAKILDSNIQAPTYSIDLLAGIKRLGFSENDKLLIIDYILNEIIGSELINEDNSYYNLWINNYNGVIDSASITDINTKTTTEDKEPRLYKGYNIVIPAIVEQALKNTFDGTTTSLYPKLNRYAIETSNSVGGLSGTKEYRSIVLMPKTNTPTTKLVLEVSGSADTIGKTISIGYDIVIAGTKYSGSKNVTLAATATEVELNLNSITSGAKLNAYDGSTASYSQTLLFGNNNEFDSSGNSTNNNGNNYIKLNFVGQDGGSFMVNFRGLYDKV